MDTLELQKANALFKLALEHLTRGDDPAAERFMRQVLEILPEHPGSLAVLAQCVAKQGRYDEGLELANTALKSGSEIGAVHYAKGFVLMQAGRYDSALESFKDAIRMNPSDPKTLRGLALCLTQTGHLAEAQEITRQFHGQQHGDYMAHVVRALVHFRRAEFKTMGRCTRLALLNGPDQAKAHAVAALHAYLVGRLKDARALTRSAQAIDPNDRLAVLVNGVVNPQSPFSRFLLGYYVLVARYLYPTVTIPILVLTTIVSTVMYGLFRIPGFLMIALTGVALFVIFRVAMLRGTRKRDLDPIQLNDY